MDKDDIVDDSNFDSETNPDDFKTEVELVSWKKFMILFFLSAGLYGLWWMYKSWKFFKERGMYDILPAARAIFAIFFAYSLFRKILTFSKAYGNIKSYSSLGLFIGYIFLNLLAQLPDPFWCAGLLGFLPLMQPVQAFDCNYWWFTMGFSFD